jgi:hypothetical protein
MIGIVEIQACTCSRSSKGPPENEKSRAIIAKGGTEMRCYCCFSETQGQIFAQSVSGLGFRLRAHAVRVFYSVSVSVTVSCNCWR